MMVLIHVSLMRVVSVIVRPCRLLDVEQIYLLMYLTITTFVYLTYSRKSVPMIQFTMYPIDVGQFTQLLYPGLV